MVSSYLYQKLASISWLVKLKKKYDGVCGFIFQIKRHGVKICRSYFPVTRNHSLKFVVMCVKRPEYVELTISNINSLHYHNPTHVVTVLADTICQQKLSTQKNQLDYPKQVQIINQFKKLKEPWQYAKIEALIYAAQRNMLLMDADSVWYADPVINPNQVTFLVDAYPVHQNLTEKKLAAKLFKNLAWGTYTHYVTGFVSLPSFFLTPVLKQKLRSYVRKIYTNQMSFIDSTAERESYRRLAEEIGVSYAVQEMVDKKYITTLKTSDGPGNTSIVQSLYYGCANKIGH